MSKEYTSGKWEVQKGAGGLTYIVADGAVLATVDSLEDGIDNDAKRKEAEANARLIASAPDMIAELVILRAFLITQGNQNVSRLNDLIDRARVGNAELEPVKEEA